MGNTPSNLSYEENEDHWSENRKNQDDLQQEDQQSTSALLSNFPEEFYRKRDQRKQILEQKRLEFRSMREELETLRQENEKLKTTLKQIPPDLRNRELEHLRNTNESLRKEISEIRRSQVNVEGIIEKNRQLRMNISEMQSEIQNMNSKFLEFEEQKEDYKRHVVALKDVIKISKELLLIRETELNQLKEKLKTIEAAFNERETSMISNDLKKEYEKQLQKIRSLRDLYEERSRTHKREVALLRSTLEGKEKKLEEDARNISELQDRISELEKDTSEKYDKIQSLESNMGLLKAETRQYQAELAVINQLFSHILLAFNNSPEVDFDKLLKSLEENHDLLKDIVNNEESNEGSSALPKVLLDLVNQISEENKPDDSEDNETKKEFVVNESTFPYDLNSPAEIAENLPKVWRILIELLSHHTSSASDSATNEEGDENRCFKTVTTSKGPSLVLSVSKTFVRLKELIKKKRSLEKDMKNLKLLNTHLETRLQEQEKRFKFVSTELSKTWNYVGKLQKEHKMLHSQEQILRYELSQKRKLLKELKQGLEYSREKWQQAREKNSKTEKEWLILRKEFAARRRPIVEDESGYSDEKDGSSDEEPGYETDISETNVKVNESGDDDTKMEKETFQIEHDQNIQNEINEETVSLPVMNTADEVQEELPDISKESPEHVVPDQTNNEGDCSFDETPIQLDEHNTKQSEEASRLSHLSEASCSSTSTATLEERLAAREEKLKKLEGQCKDLVSQVTSTSNRSLEICTKLDDLHELYGENASRNTRIRNSTDDDSGLKSNKEKH